MYWVLHLTIIGMGLLFYFGDLIQKKVDYTIEKNEYND